MSGITMHVTLDAHEALKGLSQMQTKAKNMRPAFKDIGEYMLRETDKRFRNEQSPEGKKWKPLLLRTMYGSHRGRKYTKRGQVTKSFERFSFARKILTLSARLRKSINYKAGSDFVAIGTNVVYAAIHQFGGKAGRGKRVEIPARPYLGINAADEREFVEIIKDHLMPS